MAIYWIDPYLEATTQGNGTTTTSNQDGSYSAPWSWVEADVMQNNNNPTNITSIDGNTLNDDDEIRIKGLPFNTLFEDLGEVYFTSTSYNNGNIKPTSSNTTMATNFDTTSKIFAYDSTFSGYFMPDAAGTQNIFFTTFNGTNTAASLATPWQGTHERFYFQCGFDSSSGGTATGGYNYPTLKQLKSEYLNNIAFNTTGTGEYNYFLNILQTRIKISSGWTSETTRGGLSILKWSNSGYFYRNNNFFGASFPSDSGVNTELHIDCPELLLFTEDFGYTRVGVNCHTNSTATATASVGGHFGYGYFCHWGLGYFNDNINKSYIVHQVQARYNNFYYGNYQNSQGGATKCTATVYFSQTNDFSRHYNNRVSGINLQIGTVLGFQQDTDPNALGFFRMMYAAGGSSGWLNNFESITCLPSSCYTVSYWNNYYSTANQSLAPYTHAEGIHLEIPVTVPQAPDTVYRAEVAGSPLQNHTSMAYAGGHPPRKGSPLGTTSAIASFTAPLSGNRWFDPALDIPRTHLLNNISCGVLKCGGNDYRTSTIDLATINGYGTSNNLYVFESNDYDDKPIIILPPYQYNTPALLYNDTISSVDCLVIKHPRVSNGNAFFGFPFVLNFPDDYDGTGQLRVTVACAKNSTAINSPQTLRIYWRDGGADSGHEDYAQGGTINSTDITSPANVSTDFTPASGTDTSPFPTSAFCMFEARFPTSTTADLKIYITNISIETI
jgi:hypothetical protein